MIRTRKLPWLCLVSILILVLLLPNASAKDYTSERVVTRVVTEQPLRLILADSYTQMSFADFTAEFGANEPDKGPASGADSLHPALGDNGGGTLARLYEYYDGVSPLSYVTINGSDDDGVTWTPCCWVDIYGGTYPSIDFWGVNTHFFGSFVPPPTFFNGGAFLTIEIIDPMDSGTWGVGFSSMAHLGWYGMTMSEIAADNGQQSWNWGVQSAVISRGAPSSPLFDVPILFGYSAAMTPIATFYLNNFGDCQTTSCDIDHVNGKTYSVYDRYESATDQYGLFIRQDYFYDWDDTTATATTKAFADTNEHIRYPVVAAYDDNFLLLAAVYHDDDPADFDIVCWYTSDGDIENLDDMATVAGATDPENFPEIQHVESSTFVCTFVSNGVLYESWTNDGGATWTAPAQVSGVGEMVIEEYRTADIADGGIKVLYEFTLGKDENTYLGLKELGIPDSDADGHADLEDNCPLDYNPDQIDDDGDGIGTVCDNCPMLHNPEQEDADDDGLGDLCDDCTDTDGDGYGDPGYAANTCAVDNCPHASNPGQEDTDSDGIGDVCDICGDADGNGLVNISDVVFLVSYIFGGGPAPYPLLIADVDCNAIVNISDAVYLIGYIFGGGPAPCNGCPRSF